ncbi:MAG TPA: PIN domain-containing protein, partial [Gemmatimonadaceae bacterium]|nr:PIN domain-containing protein [Gemmatimonadaceae bacterium]
ADDQHHAEMVALFERDPAGWILPWAILPEVDYLLLRHVGDDAERAFVRDVADGAYIVEWNGEEDVERARELIEQYGSLKLGLVDALVVAVAERLRAAAIATLDLRDFAAVDIRGRPRLYPRDA